MTKTITNTGLLFLLILAFASCTERIDIELDSAQIRLSVEGHITTDTTRQWIKLTQSKDYYSDNPVQGVSGAILQLSDGEQTVNLSENPSQPGLYETSPNYVGVAGRTYELAIDLKDEIGGNSHYSAEAELKPVGSIDSIEVVYNDNWEIFEVHIFALEPPRTD